MAAPASIEALVDAVTASAPGPLVLRGAGTKRPADAADRDAVAVDLGALTGLTSYDPAECVVTVRAGTPVAEVAGALEAHGQYLPWDPPLVAEGATVGGMIASGLSGPGRLRYGGVRDFVIGATIVDGRGRRISSGGQVVKNAAGFLLHHALVGSAGRLGVIAEVSLKVFPRADASCSLVAYAPSREALLAAHERLRLEIADLDALELDVVGRRIVTRLTGPAAALPARVDRVASALALPADRLVDEAQAALWRDHGHAVWHDAGAVVKVPATPARLPGLLDRLSPFGRLTVSVAGAVVYLSTDAALADVDAALAHAEASAAVVRGRAHGQRLGLVAGTAFLARVRATLDPDERLR